MTAVNELNQRIGQPVAWKGALKPQKKLISGRYCSLLPVDTDAHARNLFTGFQSNTDATWTYLPYGPFESLSAFSDWLSHISSHEDPLFFVIMNNASKVAEGLLAYARINSQNGTIEIAHVHYSSSIKNKREGTETIYLLLREAFDVLGYRRCEWKCNSFNEASKKAALRLGFTYEGTFRQERVVKGYNRDTSWYSIIDCDWPVIRGRLKSWLSPDNFHPDGTQKLPLQAF